MADQVNPDELRARFERDELQGAELVDALVLLLGIDRMEAELIASGDFLPKKDGDQQTHA